MTKHISIALAALAVTVSGAAMAQDIFGEPNSGTVVLSANFDEDPTNVDLISGGEIDASEQVPGCAGFISENPDVRLSFTASENPGVYPLSIYVTSGADTTLVVNAPDGRWYCNDDRNPNSFDPIVVFGPAQTGDYEIWVGSFEEGEYNEATLSIAEFHQ